MFPDGMGTPKLQRAFVAEVEAHGRNAEFGLMRRFFMSYKPLNGLKNLGLALSMFRKGRLSPSASKVSPEGQRQLKAISEKAKGG
jgi:hypothetical protein